MSEQMSEFMPSIQAKDVLNKTPVAHVFHITDKNNSASIIEHGLIPGKLRVKNVAREPVDRIIDMYCRILKIPANRKLSVFAFIDNPSQKEADNNLPYDSGKHVIADIAVDPTRVFVADSEQYDDVFLYYTTNKLLKAHTAAIRYCKSIQTLSAYQKKFAENPETCIQKPEVLIPMTIGPKQIHILP